MNRYLLASLVVAALIGCAPAPEDELPPSADVPAGCYYNLDTIYVVRLKKPLSSGTIPTDPNLYPAVEVECQGFPAAPAAAPSESNAGGGTEAGEQAPPEAVPDLVRYNHHNGKCYRVTRGHVGDDEHRGWAITTDEEVRCPNS